MQARPGDWLIIQGRTDTRPARRAEIVEVSTEDGGPPYRVRWADTGHTGLVFPGPDASVVSADQLAEVDRRSAERAARVHALAGANPPRAPGQS